ncbi:ABC-2 type transport system ATP-binding protein [Syntrophus gentianae]|uniref:ABC-2 type transport system ATP-binding protein n=1 Tax=Syntrophus gentianae TaxID=43775 RepID=A0A1H7VS21_9BACT|nr:ATP-binding cassette domain-containing protein [Syntrophus gentianae]SEM11970.1 ABC-2 type transport system ATP-binding protein [Syntrophus gentianae]
MISVERVSHSFNGHPALNNLSFRVAPGECFGLLGPNGAGKSTLINILVTLLQPDSGSVAINGWPLETEAAKIRSSIGVLFQDSSLDERLTAYENLYFHAMFYHVPPREAPQRIAGLLALIGLADRSHDLVITFSGGMKRRLEIARSILHHPRVLLLDEATVGLDPQARRRIWDYIATLRRTYSLTVLLTTHYLEEAEICDRIAILDKGAVIACDTPARLKELHGQKTLDDLFLHLTGRDLQDSETGELERLKAALRVRRIK